MCNGTMQRTVAQAVGLIDLQSSKGEGFAFLGPGLHARQACWLTCRIQRQGPASIAITCAPCSSKMRTHAS